MNSIFFGSIVSFEVKQKQQTHQKQLHTAPTQQPNQETKFQTTKIQLEEQKTCDLVFSSDSSAGLKQQISIYIYCCFIHNMFVCVILK